MSKALIEKATNYAFDTYGMTVDFNDVAKDAFIAGATWQREQLIQELREWVKDNSYANGTCKEDVDMFIDFNYDEILAKLDLLEKGGE